MEAVIRKATLDDVEAIVYVGHRTWPLAYAGLAGDDYVAMGLAKWWTVEATTALVEANRCTVAQVEGQVVGVAAAGPLDGELVLWKLYVVPEHQGRGIGGQLLDRVLADATLTGYRDIRLAYLDGNTRGARFYRDRGFVEIGRESGGDGIPDSVWVRREVREPT